MSREISRKFETLLPLESMNSADMREVYKRLAEKHGVNSSDAGFERFKSLEDFVDAAYCAYFNWSVSSKQRDIDCQRLIAEYAKNTGYSLAELALLVIQRIEANPLLPTLHQSL